MTTPAPSVGSQALKKAVIYLRVSTRDQATRGGEAEGFSIPAQREACLRKAQALGATVVEEFVDAGESARSANRPSLQEMLAYIRSQPVDFVIVHKVDRLARNRVDDVEINVALTTAGAQLVSCTENIDETPSGMLLHGIMSSIAEFYSRNLATESKKGMLQKARNGGTNGRAPFGYLNSRRRTDEGREVKTVEVDPDRAHWVPWMFERYATGEWTASMIADELAHHGVTTLPTPSRPRTPLSTSHVSTILKNRYYLGLVRFEGVEFPGRHPALVSEALFQTVQEVRASRHESREKPRIHTHPLKGTVFCGECGEALTLEVSRGRAGTLYTYFYCLGRQGYKNGCTFRAVQAHIVEELVEDHWAKVTLSPDQVREIRQLVWAHIERVVPQQSLKHQEAQRRLAENQRQADKLLQAHYADAITLDQLKREQTRLASERAVLEALLTETQVADEAIKQKLEHCCDLLSDAQRQYLAAGDRERRDLNQAVFSKIYIFDDEVVGSDLTPAFRRLIGDDLRQRLEAEEATGLTAHVRTGDLSGGRGKVKALAKVTSLTPQDLPGRSRRMSTDAPVEARLDRERPHGRLRWERRNPEPLQVLGSNVPTLVAGAGFEPATSGL